MLRAPGDPRAFAAAVRGLLGDPPARARSAQGGRGASSASERTVARARRPPARRRSLPLVAAGGAGRELRVLIAVTHLLGAGHLTRAAALGAGLRARQAIRRRSSPAACPRRSSRSRRRRTRAAAAGADGRHAISATLLDEDGAPVDADRLDAARHRSLDALRARPARCRRSPSCSRSAAASSPTSSWRLLETPRGAAAAPPLIVASIRDILVAPAQARARRGDARPRSSRALRRRARPRRPRPRAARASWPVDDAGRAARCATPAMSTRAPAVAAADGPRSGIVVSGGSSAASLPLYRAAARGRRARCLSGPGASSSARGVARPALRRASRAAAPAARHRRARAARLPRAARRRRGLGQPGRLQHRRRSSAHRRRGRARAVRGRARDRTAPARRTSRRARPRAASLPEAELVARTPRGRRPAQPCGRRAARDRSIRARRRRAERRASSSDLPRGRRRARAARRRCRLGAARRGAAAAPPATAGPSAFWWRDDDAVADTPALDRLLALARRV